MATNEDHYGEPNFQHIAPHARVTSRVSSSNYSNITISSQVSQHVHLYPTTETVKKGQQKSIPFYDALLAPSDATLAPLHQARLLMLGRNGM